MAAAGAERPRLEYIDGLRGLAILLVVAAHVGLALPDLPEQGRKAAEFATVGVQLFFILSALTLLSVYSTRSFSGRDFFVRRFFRIAPAFYLAGLAYTLLAAMAGEFSVDGQWLLTASLTAVFLHVWLPDTVKSVVPGGWSIGVEAMFYIAFPFVIAAITNFRRAIVAVVAAVVLATLYARFLPPVLGGALTPEMLGDFIYFGPVWNAAPFFLGAALFYALRRADAPGLVGKNWMMPALLLGCSVLLLLGALSVPPFDRRFVVIMLLAVLVFLVSRTQTRIFVNSVMRRLGQISFSCYLVHFAVIDLAMLLLFPHLAALGATVQFAILFLVVTPVSAAMSWLTWKYIEEPGIGLGRRIAAALPAPRGAEPAFQPR